MPSTGGQRTSRLWIPPPALTSRSQKTPVRNSVAKDEKSDSSPITHSDENIELAGVLKGIKKLKEILNRNDDKDLHDQQKKLAAMKISLEKVRDTAENAVQKLQDVQIEKSKIERALTSVEHELFAKAEENTRLSKHKDILTSRLKLVEESASEAIKSIIPVSEFIRNLKSSKDGGSELSATYLQDIISKLLHLVNMNQLVLSSVNAKDDDTTLQIDTNNKDADQQVVEMKKNIERLQNQLEEDRKKILNLQKSVSEPALVEKEKAKTSIRIQRERANKYLSVIDALKYQIFQKNTIASQMASEINSLKLHNSQLKSEKERLEIEKNTLYGDLVKNNVKTVEKDQTRMEELSSKLTQALLNIDNLETEKLNLKARLTKADAEIQQLKLETEHLKVGLNEVANKNTQTNSAKADDSADLKLENTRLGMELWQQLQSDKLNIMTSLKELEKKLEVSQQNNAEFRKEIFNKEETLKQIHLKLQEKVEENHSLRQLLESALADVRKYSNHIDQRAQLLDQVNVSRISELEKQVYDSRQEKEKLQRTISEMEKKYVAQVEELQERLELAEKSKNTMHDYVKFLKTSYASVFGDCLANQPFRNDL